MPSFADSGHVGAWPHFVTCSSIQNKCDAIPFLAALQRQCDAYKASKQDMLKEVLSNIGLCYGMCGSEQLFHTFGPAYAHLVEHMSSVIMDRPPPSLTLPCHALVGYDVNSLDPWAWCKTCPSVPTASRMSRTTSWTTAKSRLAYEATARGMEGLMHASNCPNVHLDLHSLLMDGYHLDTAMVFQFEGYLFHGQDYHRLITCGLAPLYHWGGSTWNAMLSTCVTHVATLSLPSGVGLWALKIQRSCCGHSCWPFQCPQCLTAKKIPPLPWSHLKSVLQATCENGI